MSPEYKVDIVIPYTFTVEAEDENEAEYKAFEEFLDFQGPPDYQVSKAIVSLIEKVEPKEEEIDPRPSQPLTIPP